MKTIRLFFLVLSVAFILTGCYDDDDWAPYESYTKKVGTSLVAGTKLSDIIQDIDLIAKNKQQNLELTSITMIFEGDREYTEKSGTIIFGYVKGHEKINQVSKMDIHYCMSNQTVEKFDWEKGHGKRVNCLFIDEISDKYINSSVSDIFSYFEQDDVLLDAITEISPKLIIELSFDRLIVYLYDMNAPRSRVIFYYNSEFETDG